jgi:hypothetical protein
MPWSNCRLPHGAGSGGARRRGCGRSGGGACRHACGAGGAAAAGGPGGGGGGGQACGGGCCDRGKRRAGARTASRTACGRRSRSGEAAHGDALPCRAACSGACTRRGACGRAAGVASRQRLAPGCAAGGNAAPPKLEAAPPRCMHAQQGQNSGTPLAVRGRNSRSVAGNGCTGGAAAVLLWHACGPGHAQRLCRRWNERRGRSWTKLQAPCMHAWTRSLGRRLRERSPYRRLRAALRHWGIFGAHSMPTAPRPLQPLTP